MPPPLYPWLLCLWWPTARLAILDFLEVSKVNANCLDALGLPSILNPVFSCYEDSFHSLLLQGNLEEKKTFPAGLHAQCPWTTPAFPATPHEQKQLPYCLCAREIRLWWQQRGCRPQTKPRRDPAMLLTPSSKEKRNENILGSEMLFIKAGLSGFREK